MAKEELDEMIEAEEEDEVREEGMGEKVKMVKSVGHMKVMEGQMKSSPIFFILQTKTEMSSVCFLMFQFGKHN